MLLHCLAPLSLSTKFCGALLGVADALEAIWGGVTIGGIFDLVFGGFDFSKIFLSRSAFFFLRKLFMSVMSSPFIITAIFVGSTCCCCGACCFVWFAVVVLFVVYFRIVFSCCCFCINFGCFLLLIFLGIVAASCFGFGLLF